MFKSIIVFFFLLSFKPAVYGQGSQPTVVTTDIDNFWIAFDSIQTTKDSARLLFFIQSLYIDKGSEGLRAFMQLRDYSGPLWVKLINRYPAFWRSIRPNTLSVKSKAGEIESSISRFKELYPQLKEARMYFTVGGLRSGGTTMGNMVLIGTEIATGDAATVVNEFPDKWLANVFKDQNTDNIVPLNIHEYVHTQQRGEPRTLLGQCIKEGACDFITELVMGKPMQTNYIRYGREHQEKLKEQFKNELFTTSYSNWLYNGANAKTVADLGYFMGYAICHSYYQQAADKKKAIRDIIELNYSDTLAVENFLTASRYYPQPLDKTELLARFETNRPFVVRVEPFGSGNTLVDPGLKELKIVFSKPMNPKHYSIKMGPKGKDHYPITGVVGYSEDTTSLTLTLNLKPGNDYEFIITDASFKSTDGYPLKPYTVTFKTHE